MAKKASESNPFDDPNDADSDHLDLWDEVCVTEDPDKNVKKGYRDKNLSFIDPHYQLKKATSLWGPFGDCWGIRHAKWQTVTAEAVDASGTSYTGVSIVLEAEFFYPEPTEWRQTSFPIIVDAPFAHGKDVMKSLLTQARSKALSYLGFSADVFAGKFDDVPVAVKGTPESSASLVDKHVRDLFVDMIEQSEGPDLEQVASRIDRQLKSKEMSQQLHDELKAMIAEKNPFL